MKVFELSAVRDATTETIKGVDFEVAVSPYAFPEYLECGYQESEGVFVIKFKYLDTEPAIKLASDAVARLNVGKHTGRLLSLEIPVDRLGVDKIKMRVIETAVRAIESARQQKPEPKSRMNYDAATEAIREHEHEIAELATA